MFAKGLEDVPTFFVCLDDPSFAKGKEIQNRAVVALSNYGSNWHFKSISTGASSSEITQLFSGMSQSRVYPNTLRNPDYSQPSRCSCHNILYSSAQVTHRRGQWWKRKKRMLPLLDGQNNNTRIVQNRREMFVQHNFEFLLYQQLFPIINKDYKKWQSSFYLLLDSFFGYSGLLRCVII